MESNRYTQYKSMVYNPLSLEELMLVPKMRAESQAATSDYLGKLENLGNYQVGYINDSEGQNAVEGYKSKLKENVSTIREKLLANPNNVGSVLSEAGNLNRQITKEMSPDGTLGFNKSQYGAALENSESLKKQYLENKISKEQYDAGLQRSLSEYRNQKDPKAKYNAYNPAAYVDVNNKGLSYASQLKAEKFSNFMDVDGEKLLSNPEFITWAKKTGLDKKLTDVGYWTTSNSGGFRTSKQNNISGEFLTEEKIAMMTFAYLLQDKSVNSYLDDAQSLGISDKNEAIMDAADLAGKTYKVANFAFDQKMEDKQIQVPSGGGSGATTKPNGSLDYAFISNGITANNNAVDKSVDDAISKYEATGNKASHKLAKRSEEIISYNLLPKNIKYRTDPKTGLALDMFDWKINPNDKQALIDSGINGLYDASLNKRGETAKYYEIIKPYIKKADNGSLSIDWNAAKSNNEESVVKYYLAQGVQYLKNYYSEGASDIKKSKNEENIYNGVQKIKNDYGFTQQESIQEYKKFYNAQVNSQTNSVMMDNPEWKSYMKNKLEQLLPDDYMTEVEGGVPKSSTAKDAEFNKTENQIKDVYLGNKSLDIRTPGKIFHLPLVGSDGLDSKAAIRTFGIPFVSLAKDISTSISNGNKPMTATQPVTIHGQVGRMTTDNIGVVNNRDGVAFPAFFFRNGNKLESRYLPSVNVNGVWTPIANLPSKTQMYYAYNGYLGDDYSGVLNQEQLGNILYTAALMRGGADTNETKKEEVKL